eukprot:scaffold8093_cov174-Skeletonema_marinoi.AAC.1
MLLTAHTAETENSNVSDDANIKGHEDSHADADNKSDESAVISSNTPVGSMDRVIRILALRSDTKKYLKKEYPTQLQFEEFLQLSSEEIRATTMTEDNKVDNADDVGENHKTDENVRARFNQNDRAKLILLRRWTENNRADGKHIECEDFDRESFDAFVREEVSEDILLEILQELKISKEVKESLKTPSEKTPLTNPTEVAPQ